MLKTINVRDLRIGMYVKVHVSWWKHPFFTNEFIVRSPDQITKLLEYGIDEVAIDPEKGIPLSVTESVSHGETEPMATPPKSWDPDKLVPSELKRAIHDKTMAPKVKSKIVYESSRRMVKRLFEDPKAENIHVVKKEIAGIVNVILEEDETAKDLLRITSYDYYTYTHSINVGVLSVLLSKALFGKSAEHDMHEMGAGFFLHDIGKVRVDRGIINKQGRLTEEEMMVVRDHPFAGYNILSETNHLTEECKIIVMQHHEREDGSGYPGQLKGDQIHTYGRICSIADVYDALTAERPYKQPLNPFNALKLMKEQMLHHFHKEMFEQFVLLFT
jgi:HD-GYP domain-containing protein (c-di-GMP phosphodiesterase class II)